MSGQAVDSPGPVHKKTWDTRLTRASSEDELDRLLAVEAIKQLKASYSRLVDTKRWSELRDIFTLDVLFEFPGGYMCPRGRSTSFRAVKGWSPNGQPMHHCHNSEIEVEGSEATGRWAMAGRTVPSDQPDKMRFGRYEEQYGRKRSTWLISNVRLILDWRTRSD